MAPKPSAPRPIPISPNSLTNKRLKPPAFACKAPSTPAADLGDAEWRSVFAHLVDPLPRRVTAVLPQLLARRSGRNLVMGSGWAADGQPTYAATRPRTSWGRCFR